MATNNQSRLPRSFYYAPHMHGFYTPPPQYDGEDQSLLDTLDRLYEAQKEDLGAWLMRSMVKRMLPPETIRSRLASGEQRYFEPDAFATLIRRGLKYRGRKNAPDDLGSLFSERYCELYADELHKIVNGPQQ